MRPKAVWTFRRREQSFAPTGIRIPDRPAHSHAKRKISDQASLELVTYKDRKGITQNGRTLDFTLVHLQAVTNSHTTPECYQLDR